MTTRGIAGFMSCLCALALLVAGPSAMAQGFEDPDLPDLETPDDPTPTGEDPALLPQEADPGPYDEFLSGLMPVSTDLPGLLEEATVAALGRGTCNASASIVKEGTSAVGRGTWSCSLRYPTLSIKVCVDRRVSGQWKEKRCLARAKTNATSLSAQVAAPCDPGTWLYRARVMGASYNQFGQPVEAGTASATKKITCYVR